MLLFSAFFIKSAVNSLAFVVRKVILSIGEGAKKTAMEQENVRINKYLSEAGYCSRRAADLLVEKGRVKVDGAVAGHATKVHQGQQVTVDGNPVILNPVLKVYAFYKPTGYISSLSDAQGAGIGSFLTMKERVYPVGRLDKDSEGLMLLTNDGALMNEILKASGGHEKEYLVTTDRRITTFFLEQMERGVRIRNRADGKYVTTAPCRTEYVDPYRFRITVIQGLNRQIRRMCGAFSYRVVSLKRIRILNVTLDGLKCGQVKELSPETLAQLRKNINGG